jgi:hypothetical protein
MFDAGGAPRSHYAAFFRRLLQLPVEELRRREQAAELSFSWWSLRKIGDCSLPPTNVHCERY